MKTISIGIQNNCTACGCTCRYCLLHSSKKSYGVDYYRGKRFTERFVAWEKENQINLPLYYCIGYCAEYAELSDNVNLNKVLGFPGAEFLQCNGIKFRNEKETAEYVEKFTHGRDQSRKYHFLWR